MSLLEKRRITKNTTARQDYEILIKALNDHRADVNSKKFFQNFLKVKTKLQVKYNFVFESELYSEFCAEFANKFL
jgi:hypothetical protein